MKKDIETKEDIRIFVEGFYRNMVSEDLVGHVFVDIAQVDWEHHLPKMVDFWEMLLLDGSAYRGAPMQPHLKINQIHPLTPAHFEHWISLFNANMDRFFEGPKAEEAKLKAKNIALTWMYKLEMVNHPKL
jgi:hemoglobin